MKPVFVLVSYQRPSDGANSGTIGSREIDGDSLKCDFSPTRDKELFAFLDTAEVGQYFSRNGGLFIFRSR
ncbi:MAG: hypothetical protein K2W95_14885 [Candidatus Obscuribacterales bacterium]|nr:hypothetical protein [Candidatus Obscuribacterales bacterium]